MSDNSREWLSAMSEALEEVDSISWDQGEALARHATKMQRANAPKRTGISARSISISRGRDREGRYIDFGPTKRGFVLSFYEYGKSDQPARPFIRPAIESAIASVWPR